jgi:hypothetical protein
MRIAVFKPTDIGFGIVGLAQAAARRYLSFMAAPDRSRPIVFAGIFLQGHVKAALPEAHPFLCVRSHGLTRIGTDIYDRKDARTQR